jgi:1,2-phenylacetyl-CoA epoxidase PaaB subunit
MKTESTTYKVFARIEAGDNMKHVGEVKAQTDRLAKLYAYTTYNEEDWNYLSIVRQNALLEVRDSKQEPAELSSIDRGENA